MSYSYRPRDPRGKLREVACKWVAAMRVAGREPNRDVVFGRAATAPSTAHTRGFLIEDRRPDSVGGRYLVLADGDVLCEPEARWLPEPEDDVIALLARALADVRVGGSGWLADGDGTLELAPDRRCEPGPYQGPERRNSG